MRQLEMESKQVKLFENLEHPFDDVDHCKLTIVSSTNAVTANILNSWTADPLNDTRVGRVLRNIPTSNIRDLP